MKEKLKKEKKTVKIKPLHFEIRKCTEGPATKSHGWEIEETNFKRLSIDLIIKVYDDGMFIGFTHRQAKAVAKALNKLEKKHGDRKRSN